MTSSDITAIQESKQDIATIAEKFDYNLQLLDDFLDLVFAKAGDDDNILTWSAKGAPGYPVSDETLLKNLERIPVGRSLYFGTSSCTPDPIEGRLYNRKALFNRFFVLVLDDIGTKVPVSKIPDKLKPTYIIESSPGNFQYGYVLKEPLDVLTQAEMLVQLVYDAGYSDDGGKMATKLVRLPDGVNGKPGKKDFRVNLVHMDGPTWTPKKILKILNLGVTWDEVVKDAGAVAKRRANVSTGTTAWSPVKTLSPNLNGTVDPVLEWLIESDMVKQELNDWTTISCPWADEHGDDNDTAGYSPLGRGVGGHAAHRAFHCFHAHCTGHKTGEFLNYVAANGGPEAAASEQAADLVTGYTFDAIDNSAWKIKDCPRPIRVPMEGFKNLHTSKSLVYTMDGKSKLIPDTTLWMQAPNRVITWGQTSDPSTESKIVDIDNMNYLNTFIKPPWGMGEYRQEDITKFIEFITYLIPNPDSSRYFLDWLACKAQDMSFRGAAIVMVAKAQGTGRTTLADMIRDLFLAQNVQTVPYEQVVGGGAFNEWMTTPIVVSNETLATQDNTSRYRSYERLKEIVDTRPIDTRINPKYGRQRVEKVYSSFLFLSNHTDAIAATQGDRRLYVLSNPVHPNTPQYFTELNQWLGTGKWMKNVWRWLQEREVSVEAMLAATPETQAKRDMLQAVKSPIDTAVDAIALNWPSPLITTAIVKDVLEPFAYDLSDGDPKKFNRVLNVVMQQQTMTPHLSIKKRICEHPPSVPRLLLRKLDRADTDCFTTGTKAAMMKRITGYALGLEAYDFTLVREAVGEALEGIG